MIIYLNHNLFMHNLLPLCSVLLEIHESTTELHFSRPACSPKFGDAGGSGRESTAGRRGAAFTVSRRAVLRSGLASFAPGGAATKFSGPIPAYNHAT